MSTDIKLVGSISEKLTPQAEYPRMTRNGGLWELTMVWLGLSGDLYRLAPAYKIPISDESVKLDEQIKRDYGHLKCSNVEITPHSVTGYSYLTVTFLAPESSEFDSSVEEEWTTNSVYKEIALTVDDIDETGYSGSGGETLEEWKAAELKRLKEQGQASKPTAEVQLQYKKQFKGALNINSIIGTIGDDVTPPGVTGTGAGNFKHIGKSIQKSKAEKTETNTYQFYNDTE